MILAATSGNNAPRSESMNLAIAQTEARQTDGKAAAPLRHPYKPWDQRVLDVLSRVPVARVKGLSKDEAKTIMEYYARSGLLRGAVSEALVAEKWTLAGGGVVGELERGTVRMRI